jgi:hypothetical protein
MAEYRSWTIRISFEQLALLFLSIAFAGFRHLPLPEFSERLDCAREPTASEQKHRVTFR